MTTNDKDLEITLRWLSPVSAEDSLLADAMIPDKAAEAKRRQLERLGIPWTPEEGSALSAWLKAMHEENGLPYSKPAHPAIADAIHGEVSSWVWWLA